jgi:ABC-type ATPase involved in cell division
MFDRSLCVFGISCVVRHPTIREGVVAHRSLILARLDAGFVKHWLIFVAGGSGNGKIGLLRVNRLCERAASGGHILSASYIVPMAAF